MSRDEDRHVTDQQWVPELREDGVYLVTAIDRTPVVRLCRPDHASDLLVAGYIVGLQGLKLGERAAKSTASTGLRTCPGCSRSYAMLHICERCGRCDALDMPRDADRADPCCLGGCARRNWRQEGA